GGAREERAVAEVLAAQAAVATFAARPAEPRQPHTCPVRKAVAFDDGADDLVPDDERELRVGKLAVAHVEIRPAYATRAHAHVNLTLAWRQRLALDRAERGAGRVENHRAHRRKGRTRRARRRRPGEARAAAEPLSAGR